MEECQNTKEMSTYPHPDLVYKIHVYVMATACQNTKEMSTYPHPDLVYKIHVYVMATANSDPEFLTSHNTRIAFEVYLINT